MKTFLMVAGLIPVVSTFLGPAQAASPYPQASSTIASAPASPHRALLKQYCVTCHNEKLPTANLALDTVDVGSVGKTPELWEKVISKVRSGAMPPPGMPRPDSAAFDTFASYLETELERVAAANPNPGRTEALHRLNRTEYQNAIRDLLALKIDAAKLLPADAADRHGFDNMAGVLGVSPALFSRYVSAAREVSRLAVGLPPTGPVFARYDVPLNLLQDDQMSEDLPFGSRGGAAIHHFFPADAEYVIKVRLQNNYTEYIRGLGRPHQVEVRLDGALIKQFTVGGDAPGKPSPGPGGFEGNILGDPEWEHYMHHADEGLEVRIPVKAGPRVIGVSFPREHWEAEGIRQPRQFGFALAVNAYQHGNPAIGSVTVNGPYTVSGPGETSSRRRIFVCSPTKSPEEEGCAKKILSTLARRAYRRPVNDADVRTLLSFYKTGRGKGSFDAGIQLALERLLSDPQFLFRIERDPEKLKPGTAYRVGDLELASRLSFFLWSSIPDDELLDAAARGELKSPPVLEKQVRRMLADPRSKALVDNFAGQWLYLRNIGTVYPDPEAFPEFDDNLREAFQRETELFIGSQLSEDRSVLELLRANYTFVNERLARHYGIPNVHGNRFQRVTLDGGQRGGLLGHGSLLTVTSYPNRTSPVVRGKWLLENILGAPPPQPPADVPGLPDRAAEGQSVSVRKRMEEHRKNPACSVCHAPMDPLGFSLENFDAIGGWRTNEGGAPIDASGVLPGGRKFEGLAGLRAVLLLNDGKQFVNTVTEKLLTYSLGRGVEHYDLPVIRQISRTAAKQDYRWSSIILGVVKSPPFQMRRSGS